MKFNAGDKVRVEGYDNLGVGTLEEIVAGGGRRSTAYVRFEDDKAPHTFSSSKLRAPRQKAKRREKKFLLPSTKTPVFDMDPTDENVHPAVRHYLNGKDLEPHNEAFRHSLMVASIEAEEAGRPGTHREAALEWSQHLLSLPLVVRDTTLFGLITGRVKANPEAQLVRQIIDHHLTEARDAEVRAGLRKLNKIVDVEPIGAVPLPLPKEEEPPAAPKTQPKAWPAKFA